MREEAHRVLNENCSDFEEPAAQMKVPIPAPRFRVRETLKGMRIVIPHKWSWGVFLVIPVEMSLLGFFGYMLFRSLIGVLASPKGWAPKILLTLFSVVWFFAAWTKPVSVVVEPRWASPFGSAQWRRGAASRTLWYQPDAKIGGAGI